MARCDSCGRDKETVEHGGRQLCLACLRTGGVPDAAQPKSAMSAAARKPPPREATRPVCYLGPADTFIDKVYARLKKVLSEEVPVYRFETVMDVADPQLDPDDIALDVRAVEDSAGSWWTAGFLTLLALLFTGGLYWIFFVPGRKLVVGVHILRGDGGTKTRRLEVAGLMLVSRVAVHVAKQVTGRWLLNITVYQLALVSLVLGLASFIPYVGIAVAVLGLVAGIIAVAVILARGLPKRMGMAVAGVLSCLLGPLVTVYLMMPPQRSGDRIAERSGRRAEAVSLEPMDAEGYFNRGVTHSLKGSHDRAIADLTRAIELKPDYAEAYASRAAAYSGKGEYDSAIADCTRAIELEPDSAEAYVSRAAAHVAKGDYDRGIADCTRAIELEPDYAEAYNNRGSAYGYNGDLDRAITDFTEAIELKPDSAEAYLGRGAAHAGNGDHDRAIVDLTRAIELERDCAEAYYERGIAYVEEGDRDRAIADWTKAIELKPGYAEAYYERGVAYARKGEYYLARSDFERAAALDFRAVGRAARQALRSIQGR